jgi:hypothetical protein
MNFERCKMTRLILTTILGALGLLITAASGSISVHAAQTATIRNIDFRNFGYSSDCSKEFGDGSDKIIHLTNGKWQKGANEDAIYMNLERVMYGDLTGTRAEQAVETSCWGATNFGMQELFVFEMAAGSPKLFARLTGADWGKGEDCSAPYCSPSELRVGTRLLSVGFGVGGSHACPDTLVTTQFRWNGKQFTRTGLDRKPYKCP